ncbi:ABC-F family ATP-binding cassette domain-containing protein [Periweissella fabalis]|uniref:ABC-F family ATP-binding cassette domain-containing protein n=1 Tax=Periweissella fabalis TaxID=1070421 RepID=A0A7X6N308_9LACO|nr:ABC-F family ATP-binding cassette domain-containing protein [Periweissella fabalis]MCM0598716.1 ABC-F family ATP-binding cassette domain-containing protein [Periweissella fabalis]NKZ24369.1 ABC-F family ATP-binding cassette domain-containing protein [Periweissella fabalis]
MILLQAQQIERRFGAEVLFTNVQLEIQEHARVALVGRNGAGKSTLLKILANLEAPDEGNVTTKKDLTVSYLAQNSGLNSTNTIWEEMLSVFDNVRSIEKQMHVLETQIADPSSFKKIEYDQLLTRYDQLQHDFSMLNGYGYEASIRSILHGFNFTPERFDSSISSLSGGQRTRLALAKALLEKPDLLILDEPTNHLDMTTLSWLENYLQSYTGALLLVSHDRYFLDRVVNEVYDMNFGHLDHYHGNYSKFLEIKAERLKTEMRAFNKQQKEIEKLEDFVNRNIVRASTTKRAQSRRKQLERMEKINKPISDTTKAQIQFSTDLESGNEVLRVRDASVGYTANNILSTPINFDVDKNHAIAIVGPNGVGKSTLLKSILNIIPFISGSVKIGANVTIGYYDQEQQTLHEHKTVLAELWDEHPTTSEKDIRSMLGSFLFSGNDIDKKISNLSGGERARVMLTKLSMDHDNFLILDEPTNHLDIDSREVLENAINEFNGTVLFVSHDRYFINQVATEIIEITPNGSTLYIGDYDYYTEKKAQEISITNNKVATLIEDDNNTTQDVYQQSKEQQREIRKIKRQVDEIELQMHKLENQQTEIEALMNNPEYSNDIAKLTDWQKEIDSISLQLETLIEDWELKSMTLEEVSQ